LKNALKLRRYFRGIVKWVNELKTKSKYLPLASSRPQTPEAQTVQGLVTIYA